MKESPKVDAIWSNNMCCSGFLIATTNTTACLDNGEWELEMSQMKTKVVCNIAIVKLKVLLQHTGKSNSTNASLRPAVISVSCLFVVASVLMFIVGFICGHSKKEKVYSSAWKVNVSTPACLGLISSVVHSQNRKICVMEYYVDDVILNPLN